MQRWARSVATRPDSALGFCEVGRDRLALRRHCFPDLDRSARRIATGLDLPPGTGVVIALEQQVEFVHVLLACLHRGLPAVPLPAPSSGARARDRFSRIVAANPGVHVVSSARALGDLSLDTLGQAQVHLVEDLAQESEELSRSVDVAPDDVAIVQFTSGSTSAPKGVAITHRALAANLDSLGQVLGTTVDDVGVSWIPFHHDMGLVGSLLHTMAGGFSTHFIPPQAFVRRPQRWLDLVIMVRGTLVVAPDFGYRLASTRVPADWSGDLSSVRIAINGSEPINPDTLAAFEQRFTGHGFDPAAWLPCYGMAEAALVVAGRPHGSGASPVLLDAEALDRDGTARPHTGHGAARALVGLGGPVGSEVEIRDEDGAPVGADVVGTVHVRGGSLFNGHYLDDITVVPPQQRAAPGEDWHETGDLGFVHEGELFVCGRQADLISRNGVSHHAVDVERRLSAIVGFPVPSAAFGVEMSATDEALLLVEVPRALVRESADQPPLSERLDAWGRELADAVGLPRVGLHVVPMGAIPRTTSGKVQRRAARARFLAGEVEVIARNGVADDLARERGAGVPA